MKFFTKAWHRGGLPDVDAAQVHAAYEAHLSALGPSLPDDARRLWTDVDLHDGLVLRVERGRGGLEVQFRGGNNQSGYVTVTLWYGGVALSHADEQFLTRAAGRRDIELLYDEVDASDGIWIHRLLFLVEQSGRVRKGSRRYYEVSVRFAALKLNVTPAAGRFDSGTA